MAGVTINFQSNIESELANLDKMPRKMIKRLERDLRSWYNEDFKPYMGRLLQGFKGKDIPSTNAEPYATYKATGMWTDRKGRLRPYNIVRTSTHSLGEVGKQWGRFAHPPGQLYRGAMAVKPYITSTTTSVSFEANFNNPFYLPVVHDGLYTVKQKYPFVDAALVSKYDGLINRLENGIVLVWNK